MHHTIKSEKHLQGAGAGSLAGVGGAGHLAAPVAQLARRAAAAGVLRHAGGRHAVAPDLHSTTRIKNKMNIGGCKFQGT